MSYFLPPEDNSYSIEHRLSDDDEDKVLLLSYNCVFILNILIVTT